MRVIYKYDLPRNSNERVAMPVGAEIVFVGRKSNYDNPCVWAAVETNNRVDWRHFAVVATGENIDKAGIPTYAIHIGTYFEGPSSDGAVFVWHVYMWFAK